VPAVMFLWRIVIGVRCGFQAIGLFGYAYMCVYIYIYIYIYILLHEGMERSF
jgi:hypothetical protein